MASVFMTPPSDLRDPAAGAAAARAHDIRFARAMRNGECVDAYARTATSVTSDATVLDDRSRETSVPRRLRRQKT